MLNCVAAIQFDEEKNKFVLVSGNNRLEIEETEVLKEFVTNAPEISADIYAGLIGVWFPEEDGIEEGQFIEADEAIRQYERGDKYLKGLDNG